ncbi:MAG: zinc transport system permease protein [Myxococcota bacterium]|jgi:zinc transport system permease protein
MDEQPTDPTVDLTPLDLAPIDFDTTPTTSAIDSVISDVPNPASETLTDPSFWDASFLWDMPILAATISGILLATIGIYIVLARASFVSAAVSQLAGLGVVAALLFSATFTHLTHDLDGFSRLFGFAFGILGTGLFALPDSRRRLSADALLAICVIGASAVTLVAAAFVTREYQHVKNALFGDAVVAQPREVWIIGLVAALLLLAERRLRSRLLFTVFDPETASAQGLNVRGLSRLLGLMISVSVALSTSGIGALPAFAFSVIPPATALLLTDRIQRAFLVSAAIAASCATIGYYVAFIANLPVGATMAAIQLIPLLGAGLLRLRQ